MTKQSKLLFRRGTQNLLRLCNKLEIPLVIVSGGVHEIVEESLRLLEEQPLRGQDAKKDDFRSITILSNQFEYDESADRLVKGYKLPLITSANKQSMIYEAAKTPLRKNVIVMGDIIDDAGMVRDQEHETILRVGFLNSEEQYERQIGKFMNTFDVIVYRDGSLCPVVHSLLKLFNT